MFTPLIWKVAPRVPVPLKLIDEPDEAVGLFCPDVGLSWKPGKISASDRKLPGLSVGLSMICSAVSVFFTSALLVLMGGAAPCTVTVSASVDGRISKSATRVWLRPTSMPSRTAVAKPSRVTVTV